jgi:DNA-binding NarL/FixJ family response regulator
VDADYECGVGVQYPPVAVAAVDDHPIVLHGLAHMLATAAPEITVMAVDATVDDLIAGPGRHAGVVLLDLILCDGTPVEANVRRIRELGAQVLILTSDLRPVRLRAAVEAGASGLVLKSDPVERIIAAVRTCRTGRFFVSSPLAHALVTDEEVAARLSIRELQVLAAVAKGLPYKLVARQLDIGTATVRVYLERAIAKYVAIGRTPHGVQELIGFAVRDGHLELPGG